MGLHSTNDQALMMKRYKTIAGLKNINELADRIEIDFNKLDSVSAGHLRDAIYKSLNSFIISNENLSEEKIEYIKSLMKQSTCNRIDIDYAKLDKGDESQLLAYGLKMSIQNVLSDRKATIYRDMTLNGHY